VWRVHLNLVRFYPIHHELNANLDVLFVFSVTYET
jgi:hypothetical protein